MDDNKDLKTPENPVQEDSVTEDTTPASEDMEAAAEESASEKDYSLDYFDDDKAEADDTAAEDTEPAEIEADEEAFETEEAPKPKKPIIQTTIIISLIIVIIAVLATLVVKVFFDKEITGTWHYVREVQVASQGATSDEADNSLDIDYYFSFGSDGTLKSTIGTITSTGTYTVSQNEDGVSVVNINVYDVTRTNFLNGEFKYDLSGNLFTGKTLVLSKDVTGNDGDTKNMQYEMKSDSYKAPTLTRDGEFEKNDDLTGKWTYSTGEYKFVYEFNDDGTVKNLEQAMSIDYYTYTPISIDITMNGIYSVKDDTITIDYYFLQQENKSIRFKREGDILYINDPSLPLGFLPFTKDGSPASVDEATTEAVQSTQQATQQATQ